MNLNLTASQQEAQVALRDFAQAEIAPRAAEFDQAECTDLALVQRMSEKGYLGGNIPTSHNGQGYDHVTLGLLYEAVGTACSSVRSLLTVHGMVAQAILRWGKPAQKEQWLPRLATGKTIGAFALSEPLAGSDADVRTSTEKKNDSYVVNGQKKWITYGQIADLFLVFGQDKGKSIALLIERDTPGLSIRPMRGLLGTRGSMVAELTFSGCKVPAFNRLAGPGFGIAGVALSALDLGRYSVAWGSVGIGHACLNACLDYGNTRHQFGKPLKEHQLIQQMVTNMVVQVKAARALCLNAGFLKDQNDPTATDETLVAKYFASQMAFKVAADAVQLHGGNGCSPDYPVERYLRDAKVMEIIEGSHQMQQMMIAQSAFRQL
jgi:alkylation response protein AidB-like acyl-CoA dehydrogenase